MYFMWVAIHKIQEALNAYLIFMVRLERIGMALECIVYVESDFLWILFSRLPTFAVLTYHDSAQTERTGMGIQPGCERVHLRAIFRIASHP